LLPFLLNFHNSIIIPKRHKYVNDFDAEIPRKSYYSRNSSGKPELLPVHNSFARLPLLSAVILHTYAKSAGEADCAASL